MGCRVSGMTTQEYRRSYDYRREYFKQNPGLFGCVWFCSQCYKPLIGKKNVVVDHILPLAKGGRNHVSNCTAICKACNSSKSDKVDSRVLKGRIFKIFESTASRANRGVGAAAGLGLGLGLGAVAGTATLATGAGRVGIGAIRGAGRFGLPLLGKTLKFTIKATLFPISHGTFVSRLCFLGVYTLAILFFLQEHTTVLNAWI